MPGLRRQPERRCPAGARAAEKLAKLRGVDGDPELRGQRLDYFPRWRVAEIEFDSELTVLGRQELVAGGHAETVAERVGHVEGWAGYGPVRPILSLARPAATELTRYRAQAYRKGVIVPRGYVGGRHS